VTTYVAGSIVPLSAEWRQYAGGPVSAMTGVTIGIVNASTAAVVLATTATGVTTPSTGFNAYTWTISLALPAGDYLITWTGVDPQGDTVTATELVQVVVSLTTYGDLATFKLELGITDATRDALLLRRLRAASAMVDDLTGRPPGNFLPSGSLSTRTVKVDGNLTPGGDLLIPHIGDLTGLAVTGGSPGNFTAIAAALYYAAPEDAIVRSQAVDTLRSAYLSSPWSTPEYVQITARWGWPATPDNIIEATYMLAARLWSRRNSPEGVIGSLEFGGVRVAGADRDVDRLISRYCAAGFA
jgi:hypothetical protein